PIPRTIRAIAWIPCEVFPRTVAQFSRDGHRFYREEQQKRSWRIVRELSLTRGYFPHLATGAVATAACAAAYALKPLMSSALACCISGAASWQNCTAGSAAWR